jgi:hypothetical protein
MTIKEAFDKIDDTINSISNKGIAVDISISKCLENKGIINSCQNGKLEKAKWKTVSFKVSSNEEIREVLKAERDLRFSGIKFDTGFCLGLIFWQIDWSLRVNQ